MPPSGYSFKSNLTFAQIRARLAELGHGTWEERESDIYGSYIRGQAFGVWMRIYDGVGCTSELGTYDPKGFMLLDYARRALADISAAHDKRVREELLPALDVTEWHEDEGND
ncbi:MAG TPA: hypothetical protein VFV99_30560 [Kofleriaceae bacterium]|nr:hypothetical protein [Kofleriaceae bacterium]